MLPIDKIIFALYETEDRYVCNIFVNGEDIDDVENFENLLTKHAGKLRTRISISKIESSVQII